MQQRVGLLSIFWVCFIGATPNPLFTPNGQEMPTASDTELTHYITNYFHKDSPQVKRFQSSQQTAQQLVAAHNAGNEVSKKNLLKSLKTVVKEYDEFLDQADIAEVTLCEGMPERASYSGLKRLGFFIGSFL